MERFGIVFAARGAGTMPAVPKPRYRMNAVDHFNQDASHGLARHLGIYALELRAGYARMRMPLRTEVMAGNGYLHAGSVVSLADTCAGLGCMQSYPEGATNFTTVELKSNFMGTCHEGEIEAVATMLHGGRTTQVWDCAVHDPQRERLIAQFRCTQLLLYPRS